jgi:hypothetical protein
MMKEENEQIKDGRPWDKKGLYETFEEADEVRSLYLDSSEEVQAKVKRTAEGKFLVKTRTHLNFVPAKKEKKRGKNSRRNKADSERRMYDASAII